MAKKPKAKATTTTAATTITITLPADEKLLRTGTMMATRGTLGSMSQFQYQSVADIAAALYKLLQELDGVIVAPPQLPAPPPTHAEVSKELQALIGDHIEPDGTCPYMVENIYRSQMKPGESWLDFIIRRKSEPEGEPLQELGEADDTPMFEMAAGTQAALF